MTRPAIGPRSFLEYAGYRHLKAAVLLTLFDQIEKVLVEDMLQRVARHQVAGEDLPADQIGDSRGSAFVGHMHEVNPRRLAEHFADQMIEDRKSVV